jgi:hypothetical protein
MTSWALQQITTYDNLASMCTDLKVHVIDLDSGKKKHFTIAIQEKYDKIQIEASILSSCKAVCGDNSGYNVAHEVIKLIFKDISGVKPYSKPVTGLNSTSDDLMTYVEQLPGLTEMVKHPVNGNKTTLQAVIIDLNDQCNWTREQVADWLETLDLDLRFKPKDDTIKTAPPFPGPGITKKDIDNQNPIKSLMVQNTVLENKIKHMEEQIKKLTKKLEELT